MAPHDDKGRTIKKMMVHGDDVDVIIGRADRAPPIRCLLIIDTEEDLKLDAQLRRNGE